MTWTAVDYYKATQRSAAEGLEFARLVDDKDLPWSDFKVLEHAISVKYRTVHCWVFTDQNVELDALFRWAVALRDVRVAVATDVRPAAPVVGINITGDLATGHSVVVYARYDGRRGDAILSAVGMAIGDEPRAVDVQHLRQAA